MDKPSQMPSRRSCDNFLIKLLAAQFKDSDAEELAVYHTSYLTALASAETQLCEAKTAGNKRVTAAEKALEEAKRDLEAAKKERDEEVEKMKRRMWRTRRVIGRLEEMMAGLKGRATDRVR